MISGRDEARPSLERPHYFENNSMSGGRAGARPSPTDVDEEKRAAGGNPAARLPGWGANQREASSTATATATVAPTIGLLPIPIKPIISTCAGTEEDPANCASLCILPIVSVMP